jgi:hypothetical protein
VYGTLSSAPTVALLTSLMLFDLQAASGLLRRALHAGRHFPLSSLCCWQSAPATAASCIVFEATRISELTLINSIS